MTEREEQMIADYEKLKETGVMKCINCGKDAEGKLQVSGLDSRQFFCYECGVQHAINLMADLQADLDIFLKDNPAVLDANIGWCDKCSNYCVGNEHPKPKTELDVFRALIENRARRFSDRTERVEAKIGVKIIKMTNDVVTSFIRDNNAEGLFDTIFKGLPNDWCVMDIDDRVIFLVPAWDQAHGAGFHNVYGVIVGSKEWPVVEGGQLIPEWKVVK